jgi:hypothetical protein
MARKYEVKLGSSIEWSFEVKPFCILDPVARIQYYLSNSEVSVILPMILPESKIEGQIDISPVRHVKWVPRQRFWVIMITPSHCTGRSQSLHRPPSERGKEKTRLYSYGGKEHVNHVEQKDPCAL